MRANLLKSISSWGITIDGHKSISEMTVDEKRERAQREADRLNAMIGHLKGYDCPICHNKGQIYVVGELYDGFETRPKDCQCLEIRRSIKRLENSGLADLADRCTFDTYQTNTVWQERIKASAEAFRNVEHGFFFIGGQSGCGKTHICTALAVSFINRGKSVKYMLWTDEAVRLKACINDEAEYYRLISPLKDCDVLYIDDLFKPTGISSEPTPADGRLAYEIINYRYNADKITIISSERTIAELKKFDEATCGRIKQLAKEYCHNIGEDATKNWRLRRDNQIFL